MHLADATGQPIDVIAKEPVQHEMFWSGGCNIWRNIDFRLAERRDLPCVPRLSNSIDRQSRKLTGEMLRRKAKRTVTLMLKIQNHCYFAGLRQGQFHDSGGGQGFRPAVTACVQVSAYFRCRLGERVSLATVPLLGFTVAAATAGMTKSKG